MLLEGLFFALLLAAGILPTALGARGKKPSRGFLAGWLVCGGCLALALLSVTAVFLLR